MPFALRRALVLAVACLTLAAACAEPVIPTVALPPTPTATPEPTPTPVPTVLAQPTATAAPSEGEPGLDPTTMRIAVIADGAQSGLGAPDVAVDVWQAVEAWAESVNATGRLANRTVEVERVDAAVFRHAEAIDLVCNGDFFAVVGSWAINDDEGLEQLRSASCSVPDFPSRASTRERLMSTLTFVSNPINADTWNAGWARHFATVAPEAAEAAGTMLLEIPTLVLDGQRMIEAASAQGYTFVYRPVVPLLLDLEAQAQAIIDAEVRSLTWRSSGQTLLDLLRAVEAIDPEYQFDFIDCGQACYDPEWVFAAGSLGNGVSVWLPVLPVEEGDVSPELARYLFFMNATHGQDAVLSAAGLQAWAAALLFEEAVDLATGAGTSSYDPSALTRQGVVVAARSITEWDALGLHGVSDPASGVPAPCVVVLTLNEGSWGRVFPERRGEFDCDPANVVELVATTEGFVAPTPTPSPTPEGGDDDASEGDDDGG